MSASSRGSRSAQRSARLRMFSVAISRRSIDVQAPGRAACAGSPAVSAANLRQMARRPGTGGDTGIANENVEPSALLGLHPDPSAVPLDDVARDRQPEAGPAAPEAGTVGLVEALEDPRPVDLRDPDAVIGDRRPRPRRRPAHAHPHLAAVGAELDRVVDEVDEHLAESSLVAADGRHVGLRRDDERDPVAVGEQAETFDGALGERAQVDVVGEHELACRPRSGRGRAARSPSGRGGRSRPRSS